VAKWRSGEGAKGDIAIFGVFDGKVGLIGRGIQVQEDLALFRVAMEQDPGDDPWPRQVGLEDVVIPAEELMQVVLWWFVVYGL
jgi:hypothetical protein